MNQWMRDPRVAGAETDAFHAERAATRGDFESARALYLAAAEAFDAVASEVPADHPNTRSVLASAAAEARGRAARLEAERVTIAPSDHAAVLAMCARTVVDARRRDDFSLMLSCGHASHGSGFSFGASVTCGLCVRSLFPHDRTGDWPAIGEAEPPPRGAWYCRGCDTTHGDDVRVDLSATVGGSEAESWVAVCDRWSAGAFCIFLALAAAQMAGDGR